MTAQKLSAIGTLERVVMELRGIHDGLMAQRQGWDLLYVPALQICNQKLATAEVELAEARRSLTVTP